MIERIIVPLDGSGVAEGVLPQAAALADAFSAEIVLLRVVEPPESETSRASFTWRLLQAEAEAYMEEIRTALDDGNRLVEVCVTEGHAAEEILQCSRANDRALLILSRHGQGGRTQFAFGDTAQQVVSAAGVSVLVVPSDASSSEGLRYRRIAVPLDGSQRAEWALCLAAAVASAHEAELHMVHVIPVPEMARRLPFTEEETALQERVVEANHAAAERYMAEVHGRFEDTAISLHHHIVASGSVARTIRDVVAELDADLLVLSAHGYSGDDQWMYGGTAGSLLAHSHVPLLVFQDMGPAAAASADQRCVRTRLAQASR